MKIERNTEIIRSITSELKKMRDGHCGVKFNCLIWKTSDTYRVGTETVSFYDLGMELEQAVKHIYDLNHVVLATKGRPQLAA